MRICWGQRSTGRVRPRHHNNFGFDFDCDFDFNFNVDFGIGGGGTRRGGGLVALGGATQFGYLASTSPKAPHCEGGHHDDGPGRNHRDVDIDINDEGKEDEGGGGQRRTGDTTARRRWGVVLPALPDGQHGCHRASPPRQRQRPLALEDKLVLCHSFVPADRPVLPPVTTTTTRKTALRPKRDEGAGRRQHKIDIIDDRWTAGDGKEGSRQEQTTTNHCVLKADEWQPAKRAAGIEKGKEDADEEEEQRGGGLQQQ